MSTPLSEQRRRRLTDRFGAMPAVFQRWAAFVPRIAYKHSSIALFVLFVITFFVLMVLQHDAFHTRALDLAKFDQAIWNTLHGRFLFSSVQNYSILGNHFSPIMALLSPLFLIWSNVRVLFLVQVIGLGVTGLVLAQIVRQKYPSLAAWFLLAFYLNPALHEVALVEFRRSTLAAPFLALILYALYTRKRWLMVVGMAFALLCQEDIALIVAMVGVYLLLFQRDWRLGLPVIAVGAAWAVIVTLWVVPAFNTQSGDVHLYPQLNAFGLTGDSYSEVLKSAWQNLPTYLQHMFDQEALKAIWRVLLPVGLILPFLAPDWLLIVIPTISYLLMSVGPGMHRLEDWYMAPALPGLFAAIAVGMGRLPERWARWLTAAWVGTTLVGYILFSHAPLGGKYEPELYRVTEHERLAARILDTIPANARVATQDPYVPHLSHREHIYLYPWISIGEESVDYVLLDRQLHPYPLQPNKLNAKIDDLIADPSYTVELEVDGIYLFRRLQKQFLVNRTAEGTMRLQSVEIAIADTQGFFHVAGQAPVEVRPGQQVRVSLYWLALDAPRAERTVSVRISDASGALAAVYDNMPGQGKKPTSWWEKGWQIRDVYYLTVSSQAPAGAASLDVLLYDTVTRESIPFEETDLLHICEMVIVR